MNGGPRRHARYPTLHRISLYSQGTVAQGAMPGTQLYIEYRYIRKELWQGAMRGAQLPTEYHYICNEWRPEAPCQAPSFPLNIVVFVTNGGPRSHAGHPVLHVRKEWRPEESCRALNFTWNIAIFAMNGDLRRHARHPTLHRISLYS